MLPVLPGQPHHLPTSLDADELAEEHLRLPCRVPERLHPGLQRLHLPVVVGAPDVDEVGPASFDLVAVVREVGEQVRGVAVGLDEHPVARITEVGGTQPCGTIGFEHGATHAEISECRCDLATLVQRPLGEPRVELHTDAPEVVAHPFDRSAVTPLARIDGIDSVAERLVHLARHVDHVLAVISVLGRLLATESGHQRSGKGVELVPRVVQVVLAVDLGSLRGEEIRERVAHRHPTRAAGVDRPRWVQRDELEIDPISRERPAVPVSLALRHDRAQDLVEPRGREVEVDEAGPGDLGTLEVREVARPRAR